MKNVILRNCKKSSGDKIVFRFLHDVDKLELNLSALSLFTCGQTQQNKFSCQDFCVANKYFRMSPYKLNGTMENM